MEGLSHLRTEKIQKTLRKNNNLITRPSADGRKGEHYYKNPAHLSGYFQIDLGYNRMRICMTKKR